MSSIFRNFLSGESKSNEKKKQEKVMPTAKKVEIKRTVINQNIDLDRAITGTYNLNTKTKTNLLKMPETGFDKNENGERILALMDISNENIIDIWLDKNENPIVTCHGGAFDGYYVLNNDNCYGPYPESITHLTPVWCFPFYFKLRKKNWVLVMEDGNCESFDKIERLNIHNYGEKFACSVLMNDQWYVYTGNEKFGPYDSIDYLTFFSNGSLLYEIEENGLHYLYYDDSISSGYDLILDIHYTDEGILVYRAQKDELWYLCYGDEVLGPFEDAQFSYNFDNTLIENGRLFSFKRNDEWYVHNPYEDKNVGPFNRIFDVIVSPDKDLLITIEEDREMFLLHNEESIGPFEFVIVCSEWFKNTGNLLYSYRKTKNAGYAIFVETKEIPTCGCISQMTVSNNKDRFVYTIKERRDSDAYVISGNEKIGPFNSIDNIEFSSDDSSLIIKAVSDGRSYIYCNDIEYGPIDYNMHDVELSYNGQALAYNFEENKQIYSRIIIDGYNYAGAIYNGKPLYVKDGEILLRD
ncbi:hypothetical protein E4O05_05475 [Treponema sp. OMZ 787]|uniref:hypothetical protein n=1 Tax=Treponema sp. OMZ 787 TaxID=2563669 RepID=UPI0020A4E41E|nr:hypothetical protein [Treponema sp. OMZ 787]UTC63336.1 hypothetical protein E4O05_05475 [Treponema sp. OMZ 787]